MKKVLKIVLSCNLLFGLCPVSYPALAMDSTLKLPPPARFSSHAVTKFFNAETRTLPSMRQLNKPLYDEYKRNNLFVLKGGIFVNASGAPLWSLDDDNSDAPKLIFSYQNPNKSKEAKYKLLCAFSEQIDIKGEIVSAWVIPNQQQDGRDFLPVLPHPLIICNLNQEYPDFYYRTDEKNRPYLCNDDGKSVRVSYKITAEDFYKTQSYATHIHYHHNKGRNFLSIQRVKEKEEPVYIESPYLYGLSKYW